METGELRDLMACGKTVRCARTSVLLDTKRGLWSIRPMRQRLEIARDMAAPPADTPPCLM